MPETYGTLRAALRSDLPPNALQAAGLALARYFGDGSAGVSDSALYPDREELPRELVAALPEPITTALRATPAA